MKISSDTKVTNGSIIDTILLIIMKVTVHKLVFALRPGPTTTKQ